MRIDKLTLDGWRNYRRQTLDFDGSCNVIYGENAQGKTNLLEAMVYLSCGKSPRAHGDRELIGFDRQEASVTAQLLSRERVFTTNIQLFRGRRRKMTVNGVPAKTSAALSDVLHTVFFCPEDLFLIRAGAAERRRFMDLSLCQLRPRYAEALAEYGVRVMVCDINDENGEAVAAGIRAKGGTAEYCHCDIMQTEQINALIARTVEVFGTVDFLINNGGGGEAPRDFFDLDDARFDHYVRLNLYSAFAAIRAAFPYMRKQNSGRIVNISSGYALCGGEQCAHYASAKAGVIGLTTSIAREAAPFNINCNVIVVPTTDTPGLHEADGEFVDDELPLIPKGRIAKPLDIANAVLYLVSEASDYVTGQILAPNGGRRMLV